MDTPSWAESRARAASYCRRRPEESALYRIVYHFRDEFERRWEELFQQQYGRLRREVLDALDRYLNCGILFCGAARAYCQNCKHSQLIAFSCKRRGLCPSCDAKRGVIFAEHLNDSVLLPHPHRHLTFSIPKRLRVYFRYDRKLTKLLYHAAWLAWQEAVSDALPAGKTGMISALHTNGDLINWHSHVHAIALDGVVDEHGSFHQLPAVNTDYLTAVFQRAVFDALLKHELITQDVVDGMRCWEHSGFNVYTSESIAESDTDRRRFVARYLKKAPLSLQRLNIIESDNEPTVQIVKHLDDGDVTRDLSPLEFLAELSCHIPDVWEQTSRYTGVYASRTRGAAKPQHPFTAIADAATAAVVGNTSESTEPKRPASQYWATCIKRIYEVDPLLCPKCGEPMKIVAFITNPAEITKLANHLGIQAWRAPPPFRRAPTQQHLVLD